MGYRIKLYFLLIYTVCPYVAATLTCPPGTFLYTIIHSGEQFCIECQDGTFMLLNNHRLSSCRPCEKIKDPKLEILISPCNKTHDAVIHCVDGYYRDEARNPRETGKCRKCSECPKFIGRPCGTYKNTICCWDENYDVVPNHDSVLMCRERPWFCRRGQYFKASGFQCLPCPDNTFMPLDYHIQPECWKCREDISHRPLHSVIVQPCNSTHAPVIRCEDGFFINPYMGYRDDATGCSPCTDCSTKTDVQYEGRKCDGMEDTVCCPRPNMTVIDTPKGHVCEAPSTGNPVPVCDKGMCPHQSRKKRSIDCAPCPPSNEADHLDNSDVQLGEADHGTTLDPCFKRTFSNDDHGSSEGIIPVYFFGGIVTGLVLSLACYLIYRAFYRHRWQRWLGRCTRSWSEKDRQTDTEDLDKSDLLESKRHETFGTPRRRQAEALCGETKQQQHKLSGSDLQPVTFGGHGREQCCGNESDLHSNRELCKNIEDHERFISAKIFKVGDLPEHFRDDNKMAYIKAVCDLTVRLKVNHTSNERPDNYPCSELRGFAGAGIKRFGTGLVFQVTKRFGEGDNGNCPCRACSVYHDNAKTTWAEFAVVTSAHVVYDDMECAQMSCKLWFDHDDDFIKSRSLNGRRVDKINVKSDFRVMHCITHDQTASRKLEENIALLDSLYERCNNMTFETEVNESKLAVLISHQHGLSKKISMGKATVKMINGAQRWIYDIQTCPGSCGAPVCILGTRHSSDMLTIIHSMKNESTGFCLESTY